MRDPSALRRLRHGPLIATGIFLVALSAPGCGGDDPETPVEDTGAPDTGGDTTDTGTPPVDSGGDTGATDTDAGPVGDGKLGTITAATSGTTTSSPFDATPDLDGKNIYFTAIDSATGGAGVFKVAASGGAITPVGTPGGDFVSPFGIAISADGLTLFVADAGAENTDQDKGAIFVLPVGGGTATRLSGTDGYAPRGLEVAAGKLWFTGTDKTDGAHGVFSVPVAGGSTTKVLTGDPFVDPSGIAITRDGNTVYVLDTVGGPNRLAQVVKVTGGTATVVLKDLAVGYPGGIALSNDESSLLVSGLDPAKNTDAVWRVQLSDATLTPFTKSIDTYVEAAGLHRAKNAEVYAWADSLAGGNGTVFVLTK